MARRNVTVEAAPAVEAPVLRWRSDEGEHLTVVVQTTFRLTPLGLSEVVAPAAIDPADMVPVKATADVFCTGGACPPPRRRVLRGISVARGLEVLWGKRVVLSAVEGEAAVTPLEEGGGPFVGASGPPPAVRDEAGAAYELVRGSDEVSRLNRAPADQRMPFLRGGEALLLTGWGAEDIMTRLPALTAHAALESRLIGVQAVPLLGDGLHVDMDRRVATVTWRGHIAAPPHDAHVRASLLPLVAVEEVLGLPPSWERSLHRRTLEPPIHGGLPLPAATFPWGRRLVVVVKGTFDLRAAEPAVPATEQPPLSGDRHHEDDLAASLSYPSDLAPHKPEVDVLATGFVYSRPGAAVASAQLSLGRVDKRIVAIGERQWRGDGTLSDPAPFERVAIRHEVAFGGPAVDANPVGTGAEGTAPPSLERPEDLLKSPSGRARPACFAPLSPTWKARDGGGSYDNRWLAERWPDVPSDFDARAFNAAPPDQRLPSLRGDERYKLTSVRPRGEGLEGLLPGLRPWCFAGQRGSADVERVTLTLDTVLFDGEAQTVTLVWRGAVEASGVARLWLSLGSIDEEPTMPWAWGELRSAPDERFSASEAAPGRTLRDVRETLDEVARKQASWAHGPPAPPPAGPQATRAEVMEWLERGETLAGRDMTGADLRGIDFSGRDLAGCVLARAVLEGARLDGACFRDANFAGASADGSSWVGADLTRADASGASLARANLSGASLEQATLAGTDLQGATLDHARADRVDLNGANLTSARLARSSMAHADLSRATLDHASFTGASLDEARLYDAEGREVSFDEASLKNARLEGARLPRLSACDVNAAGSMWERAALTEARLLRASLREASLEYALLDRAILNDADATSARFGRASLIKASLLRTNLMMADLEAADLRDADLCGANLFRADTRDALLEGARTEHALVAGSGLAPRA